MKRFWTRVVLGSVGVAVLALPAVAAKPDPTDYTLKVQVRCNRIRYPHGNGAQQMGVTIEGKPYELTGESEAGMLRPGKYQARLKSQHADKPYNIDDQYELLLPDGKTWTVILTGVGFDPCKATE